MLTFVWVRVRSVVLWRNGSCALCAGLSPPVSGRRGRRRPAWQGGGMTRASRLLLTGIVVGAALLSAAGCSASGTGSAALSAVPSESPSATPKADIRDLITPTPEPTTPPTAEALAQTVDAGALVEGSTATASGDGPSNVTYSRQGEFAVVIALDCSACTGTATVTAPGRMSPLGESTAPMNGSYLMDVFKEDPVDQTLIVEATGPWSVTLSSWNDLPLVSGAQSGTGPTVLFFRDDVAHVSVDFTPAGPDDSFQGRVFTTSDRPQLFGDSAAFSEVFDADLPGVMSIQTNGSWTVTPTP